MSELLKRKDAKVQQLKELIQRLHRGEDQSQIREEFIREFTYVSGAEIAQMEQQLVQEGMDIEEIMNLCDIHASLFQDNLVDLHSDQVHHPFDYFRNDNTFIQEFMDSHDDVIDLAYVSELYDYIDAHYNKKEQLLFPLLEYVDVKTIPQVMWGVDNEIRSELKAVQANLVTHTDTTDAFHAVKTRIQDMITKENNVLYQMLEEHLSTSLWTKLDQALQQDTAIDLSPEQPSTEINELLEGRIQLPSGSFTPLELENILNVLPIDITFVDKNDRVAYVSQGTHRVFDRPLTVIGREVRLCHPPQSVHIVEQILDDFKNKRKDHEFFWISFKGMFVYIQYFAIYDKDGNYLGVVEASQDVQGIRELEGQKRLAE
ncbi:hypothetical protein A4S06_04010 [Erysipelotrichaceae bacterium MTC7]|nr:hypothetical protein A4S06_04010 [Erysipelotrichaceae bacterium MTC7]